MPIKRRRGRESSPPVDVAQPPATVDELSAWFNEVALAVRPVAEAYPLCPRVRALQGAIGAWGRVRKAAASVEMVLRARKIREGVDYEVGDAPPDDPMVLPLWHVAGVARATYGLATADVVFEEDARAVAAALRVSVAGVSIRETAETDAFKRHHGIRDPGRMVRQVEDEVAPGPGELAAQADLLAYGVYCTPGFRVAPHHRVIADALMRVVRGATKRLMISMPPRSGKSFLVSQHFPAFFLGHHPAKKVMAFSVTADLAGDFGIKTRNLVASSQHTRVFPGCVLAEGDAARTQFRTAAGGEYFALGIGNVASGRGAHLGIIDDAYNDPAQASSETYRRTLREWYQATFRTRIMPGGAIVVMHTRWAEDDLSGWLLDEHRRDGWEVISIPAIAEEDELWITSEGPWARKKGDPVDPEWWRDEMDDLIKFKKWSPKTTPPGEDPIVEYAVHYYEGLRQTVGARFFSALYQQRPTPGGGGKCQVGWFKRYARRPDTTRVVLSVDTGQKGGADNDPTVVMVWGQGALGHYVLDVWRERVIYPRLVPEVVALIEKWSPDAVLVEDQNNGATLLQDLGATQLANRVPLIGVSPRDSKVVRFDRVSPMIEGGRVWIPERDSATPWLAAFEEELATFPLGKHDDQVDALSQYLNWARRETMTASPGGGPDAQALGVVARLRGGWAGGGAPVGGGFRPGAPGLRFR